MFELTKHDIIRIDFSSSTSTLDQLEHERHVEGYVKMKYSYNIVVCIRLYSGGF